MQHRLTLTLLLAVSFAPAARAADWTEFRGPTGQGLAAATGLPIKWSDTENVAWKREIAGKGWSSPILLGGRVYLTTAVPVAEGGEQSLRAMCLEAATGNRVWDVDVFHQPSQKIHGKNSHASATPITDGKHLFVHFGTHGTACLDLTGKIVWTNRELKYSPVHGNGGSPVLLGGLLIVSCDGSDAQFVAALDQKTGKIRWKTERRAEPAKGFSFGTPLVIEVAGKKQVVSAGSNAIVAYEPATGTEIWRVRYDGYSVVPRPVYGQGLLFVCTGYDSPSLLAIRPEGAGDVTDTHVAWKLKTAVPHNPSPLLVGSELYLISDRGIATCLDAKTGKERWQQRIGGNFSASPVFADGKVFLQSEEGEGIVIKAGTTFEELARNSLGERTLASYAVAEGAIFIRSEHHLARMQAK